jgi:hypothetical protein
MNIRFSDEMALLLETIVAETKGLEFSGFGYAKWEEGALTMYDFVLLNVGSSTYTEIGGEQVMKLASREDAKNLHIWVHRHPVGNGIPGYQNWSTTDENTIWQAPLGMDPAMVKWTASVVRTPMGWVGRIDDIGKHITEHVEVMPHITREMFDQVHALQKKANDEMMALYKPYPSYSQALRTPLDAESDIEWPDEVQYSYLDDELDDATAKSRRKAKKSKDQPWWRIWK